MVSYSSNLFYDKDGNYLSSYSSNYPGYISSIFKIPDGASSFKLSIYDEKVNTNKNVFINDFNSGDLALTYGFISDSLYTIGNEIILTSTKDSSDDTNNEESDDTDNTDDESNNNIDNTNNEENDNTDNHVDENNNNVDNINSEESDNIDNPNDENNSNVDNTNNEENDNIDVTAKVQTDNVLDELSQIEKDGNDNVKIDNKSNNIVPLVILSIAIIAITTLFIIFKIVKKKVL